MDRPLLIRDLLRRAERVVGDTRIISRPRDGEIPKTGLGTFDETVPRARFEEFSARERRRAEVGQP